MVSINKSKPKFKLGKIVATQGAIDALEKAQQYPESFLDHHATGDRGNVWKEDAALNDEAVAFEGNSKNNSESSLLIIVFYLQCPVRIPLLLPAKYF